MADGEEGTRPSLSRCGCFDHAPVRAWVPIVRFTSGQCCRQTTRTPSTDTTVGARGCGDRPRKDGGHEGAPVARDEAYRKTRWARTGTASRLERLEETGGTALEGMGVQVAERRAIHRLGAVPALAWSRSASTPHRQPTARCPLGPGASRGSGIRSRRRRFRRRASEKGSRSPMEHGVYEPVDPAG